MVANEMKRCTSKSSLKRICYFTSGSISHAHRPRKFESKGSSSRAVGDLVLDPRIAKPIEFLNNDDSEHHHRIKRFLPSAAGLLSRVEIARLKLIAEQRVYIPLVIYPFSLI